MFKAYFFDMDGVLYDSMPNHAAAWEKIMQRHGLHFTKRDCYLNEGRTGYDVIHEAMSYEQNREVNDEEIDAIYREKTESFSALGGAKPMRGILEVLTYLKTFSPQIWIVTGSGQQTLFDRLQTDFPSIFTRERMVTAFDVRYGKPNPEPYLIAWQRSGLQKQECVVIENAPLGVKAGKAAGLFVIAVNTGVLTRQDLYDAGADIVLNDMAELLLFMKIHRYVESEILPQYDSFDKGHRQEHARHVMQESLNIVRELSLKGEDYNPILAYLIAAYHDIGLRINREEHHLYSGKAIREDTVLRQWFDEEQIEQMAQAAEDHRASRKEQPRSMYGCIVAEADRQIDPLTVVRRTVLYGLKHYPDISKDDHINRAICHLQEKYGENGYLRCWLQTERNRLGLQRLREMIAHERQLRSTIKEILQDVEE